MSGSEEPVVYLHDPPLGFSYDGGGLFIKSAFDVLPYGLNNQLMILANFIEASCMLLNSLPKGFQSIILRLPLFSGDYAATATVPIGLEEPAAYIEFEHLFDLEYFNRGMRDICGIDRPVKFISCYNYQESSTECRSDLNYDYYQHATVMVSKMRTKGPVTMRLYNSLSPSARIQAVLDECRSLLTISFRDGGTNNPEKQLEDNSSITLSLPKFVAVHMRVERDWVDGYCQEREIEQGYRTCFYAGEIAKLVSSYLRNNNATTSEIAITGSTNVYIIVAVDRVRDSDPDPESVWPTNYGVVSNKLFATSLLSYTSLENYTERAVLDMFIAFDSEIFIGMTQSTMSNAITMRRFFRGKTSYAYDCDVEGGYSSIRLRTDRGEYDSPHLACLLSR